MCIRRVMAFSWMWRGSRLRRRWCCCRGRLWIGLGVSMVCIIILLPFSIWGSRRLPLFYLSNTPLSSVLFQLFLSLLHYRLLRLRRRCPLRPTRSPTIQPRHQPRLPRLSLQLSHLRSEKGVYRPWRTHRTVVWTVGVGGTVLYGGYGECEEVD